MWERDAACDEEKLIIEIDGGQHSKQIDAERDMFLVSKGMTVLHYWNNDVLRNIEGVLTDIKNHIGSNKGPSPKPSPVGRGLNKRILIGKIASAHGIKGDVKVLCYASDPNLLFSEDGVFTDEQSDKRIILKYKSEPKTNLFIANIKGMTDRNAAEAARGTMFYIDREALPELEDGIYHSDLEGMDVVSHEGKFMGKVIRVQNFGASDLLEIQGKKESYYLPFVAPYLVSVDKDANRIIVNSPEVMDAR